MQQLLHDGTAALAVIDWEGHYEILKMVFRKVGADWRFDSVIHP